MTRKTVPLALLTAVLCLPMARAAQPASPNVMTARVPELAAAAGADIGMALRTLDGRTEALVNADESFHAASTMKVPVMIELFRQRDAGRLSLDDTLVVRDTFSSIVDGSPYDLAAEPTIRTRRSTTRGGPPGRSAACAKR